MSNKLPRQIREALVLEAAVSLATTSGVFNLTFESVGKACDPVCSERTVRDYFPRKTDLFRAVIAADPHRFADEALMMDDDE